MKATGFESILAGFSKISALKFEILDKNNLANSSVDNSDPLYQITTQILESKKFKSLKKENQTRFFGLPLFDNDNIAGVLLAYFDPLDNSSLKTCPSCEDAETLLTRIADLIQDRWESQNESEMLITELDRSYESLHLYSNVATKIKTLNFSSQMIIHLMNEIKDNIRVDMAFSNMQDRPDFSRVVYKSGVNIENKDKLAKALINAVNNSQKPLDAKYFIVNNSRELPQFSLLHQYPFRFLAVKIQHNENFYGWLGILSFNMTRIIERSELRLLVSIAEQVGVVISNTDLYNSLEGFGINIVKSLIVTIEAKDIYTGGHSERVHHISMLMAQELGMSEEQKKILNWSALLHDIGKIGIPEAILNKPEKLNDREYSIIKNHPLKGAEILKPLDYLAESIPGILHHHEAYNGRGYPSGLKGNEIPLISRIIAVADTFDAITSNRAYRKGRSYEKGLEIINEVARTQLDPEQVQIFNKIYPQVKTWLETKDKK